MLCPRTTVRRHENGSEAASLSRGRFLSSGCWPLNPIDVKRVDRPRYDVISAPEKRATTVTRAKKRGGGEVRWRAACDDAGSRPGSAQHRFPLWRVDLRLPRTRTSGSDQPTATDTV